MLSEAQVPCKLPPDALTAMTFVEPVLNWSSLVPVSQLIVHTGSCNCAEGAMQTLSRTDMELLSRTSPKSDSDEPTRATPRNDKELPKHEAENTANAELNLEKLRTDSDEPKPRKSNTDMEAPKRAVDISAKLAPIRANARTENGDRGTNPRYPPGKKMDKEEAKRAKERIAIDDPKCTKLNTDKELPRRPTPQMDIEAAKRCAERTDSDDPRLQTSRTDNVELMRAVPNSDKVDTSRENVRSARVDPTEWPSRIDTEAPNRAK